MQPSRDLYPHRGWKSARRWGKQHDGGSSCRFGPRHPCMQREISPIREGCLSQNSQQHHGRSAWPWHYDFSCVGRSGPGWTYQPGSHMLVAEHVICGMLLNRSADLIHITHNTHQPQRDDGNAFDPWHKAGFVCRSEPCHPCLYPSLLEGSAILLGG